LPDVNTVLYTVFQYVVNVNSLNFAGSVAGWWFLTVWVMSGWCGDLILEVIYPEF